jgi:hypothetical protein
MGRDVWKTTQVPMMARKRTRCTHFPGGWRFNNVSLVSLETGWDKDGAFLMAIIEVLEALEELHVRD